jgi:hypothetical protein
MNKRILITRKTRFQTRSARINRALGVAQSRILAAGSNG